MKEKSTRKQSPFACTKCTMETEEEQSKLKQFLSGICPAYIGYFIVLVMILIMQFSI